MSKYHKIQTLWRRDPENKHKTLLEGEWAKPEFEYLRNADWSMTEKVDGTNIRLMRTESGGEVRGKSDAAQMFPGMREACEGIISSDAFLALGEGMILYGEGYGAGIQKGAGYREDKGFVLFDVWFGMWLERQNVEDIAQAVGADVVPVLRTGPLEWMISHCREGFASTWGDFPAEGLVARPMVGLTNRYGERVITKLKCKDFA